MGRSARPSVLTSTYPYLCSSRSSPRTTVRILKKLETYSWDAKAVLTLAAFAMEFRDFSCPISSQFHQLAAADQEFAESLSISTKAQKCGQRTVDELREIKNCIMTALQVLEAIFKLHKLTSAYNKEGLSELKEPLMVYIYWIIMAVVTCATRITVLTWDE
ncbi:Sieve element occlusion, N-terminal [Trema orientale]|uniref:Sieve element occlusion, N-terminal n=1 Tax=Trema orientale TaxID=63057 RepID=A0A2P5ECP0_TREOI|nr:Sieve element occlusion, N-terminal [Trema orientale]